MPTGVGTALLISAAIGAGTSAVEAGIQSKQTSKAVKAQTDASTQAQNQLKPFQQTGTQAFQTLGSLMGLGGGGGGGAAPAVQSSLGATGQVTGPSTNYPSKMGAISDPSVLGGNSAQAPGGGGALMGTPGQVAASQAASSYPGYGPKTSPIPQVTMKAPDGSTNQVPADQVSYWTQKGATVVS
jgi:hypothetical protein